MLVKKREEILEEAFLRHRVPRRTAREFEEILVAEFVSVTGGVLAGALLGHFVNELVKHPGILILLPGFLAMRGNISGALSARIGAALHLNLLNKHKKSFLHANALAAFVLSLITAGFLGIVAYAGTRVFFHANAPDIILVALFASIISNLLLIPLTTRTTIWLYRHEFDPDNIMGPYITTIGDVISVVSLIVAVVII